MAATTVFVDVDTQLDFMVPAGALYVPGAELVIPMVAKLNRLAATTDGIRLLSTVDAHSENDAEFQSWPPHCIAGTIGQKKPTETLVDGQIVFQKVTTDAFLHPGFMPLLAELNADRYVVYGVVSEICVRFAALGLLRTGKPVDVVTDAIQHLSLQAKDRFYEELAAAGGKLIPSSSLS